VTEHKQKESKKIQDQWTDTREDMKIDRRELLGKVALGSILGAGALAVLGAIHFLTPRLKSERSLRFKVGRVTDFRLGNCFFLQDKKIFIIRNGNEIRAVSAVCTHLGCTIQQSAQGFRCSCHGSRFDGQGRVLKGPAPRPLEWLKVEQAPDKRLIVDASQIVGYEEKLEI